MPVAFSTPTRSPSPAAKELVPEHQTSPGLASVLIVGASVAGVRVARELRRLGFDGRITITSAEESLPYDKPPLSKHYLAGTFDVTRISLLEAADVESLRLDLHLGSRAVGLSADERIVVDASGKEFAYDVCVVATGASARPSPWGGGARVHLLRTLQDSDRLRNAIGSGRRVAVVGGGLIGSEVASTAVSLGAAVTVIDPLQAPMARLVGADIATEFTSAHERHGVRTLFGVGVSGLVEHDDRILVGLDGGGDVEADLVVVGIGAVTNDAWLAACGVETGQGIECDRYGRVVGVDALYAAGDVARWPRPPGGEPQRVEHWTNAVEQAAIVAYNIVHPDAPVAYEPIDYVWSDQHDLKLQLVGWPQNSTLHHVVGERSRLPARFAALYSGERGILGGAVTVNWPRALAECRRLLSESAPVDAAKERLEALYRPAETHVGR